MNQMILIFMLCLGFCFQSHAQVQIDINQAKTKKSLIAFPPFQFVETPGSQKKSPGLAEELSAVVLNDLSVSSYFQFITQSAFLEEASTKGIKPIPETNGFKFDSWKQIGSDFLIRGNLMVVGEALVLETYIYDVTKETTIFGKKYQGPLGSSRRIAHSFANDFVEALTGTRGMFLSKIVAASDQGDGKVKEIYSMDWDGANLTKISNHDSIALSPAWSPDAKKIAYTAFVQRTETKVRNSDMFLYDIPTGTRKLISYRTGVNSGAAFAPDGDQIYLTLSESETTNIYKLDLTTSTLTRLTSSPKGVMNVEPAISPDGKKIAFSSDRGGNTMIYIMESDGSKPTLLTLTGKLNSSPAWSPDGKRLAFASLDIDHFDIFTMNIDGSEIIRVTSAKKQNGKWAENEDPVFSHDGRHVMYTSNRTGSNQIYISNLDGSNERRITLDNANYFKPKWSKNIE